MFYEVLVRGFADSNGDGTGDLRGLTEKLDYLQWLGIDCLWLPPFYPSPLRDGGYDVSDFTGVLPEFGTVDDFKRFLDAAHERGIRVIIDFVMNHTSDQHPWFQASRTDPDGPYGDFYVWNDDDKRYPDARIIFVDTEPSNWTFDPVRKQYFWHRFFSHQPDLNFDSPGVQEAILDALRFWLDLGIDGFRLDAVPYLYVRDGTNGENLPETHEFLKRVRKEVDRDYPDRVLLCEANQWPADVVEYFGDPASGGDECHMAFHFPVMPRIFMAVRRESRYPISEIMAQTPPIPDRCQWGIFLRNHDELTLEMVTDEERDYMWSEYANDPRMKANIGIRRRLAPLLENDINQIELFTALLLVAARLARPLLRRRDRHGRQHLARRPRRRAHADAVDARPQRRLLDRRSGPAVPAGQPGLDLRLPGHQRRVADPQQLVAAALDAADDPAAQGESRIRHGHVHRHRRQQPVRAQLRARVRRRHRAVRQQPVALRRSRSSSTCAQWEGAEPVELLGGAQFPRIGELPYLLTVAGHGFYWLRIPRMPHPDAEPAATRGRSSRRHTNCSRTRRNNRSMC